MLRSLSITLMLLGLAWPAQASEWALEEWLAEPDVKLVAVEFYADWCKPCKAAAPKWEALRRKYAPQGLKLVVVNLSEAPGKGGRCSRLPWNPDESICDPSLGEALGVTELPEAFVWSWQGNLLVDRGRHISEIEAVIRRYLDDNPRVAVIATDGDGTPDRALQRQVEAKLSEAGKLSVVPDADMRRRIARVREESHGAERRDDQRCILGAEVSANSLLKAERFPGSLALTLVDANTGCQLAMSSVDWDQQRSERAVNKALFKLMNQITRREVQMPGQGAAAGDEARDEARDEEPPQTSQDDASEAEPSTEVMPFPQNAIFAEVGGGTVYSVNYERVLASDFTLRVGFGYVDVGSSDTDGPGGIVSVPIKSSWLGLRTASNTHTLEFGLGMVLNVSTTDAAISVISLNDGTPSAATFVSAYVNLQAFMGYRLLTGAFQLRVGIEPSMVIGREVGFFPWLYLSLGAAF